MFFTPEPNRWPLHRRRGNVPAPIQPNPIPPLGPGIPPTDWRIPMSPRAGLVPPFTNLLRPLVLPDVRSPYPWSPKSPFSPRRPHMPPGRRLDHGVRNASTRCVAPSSDTMFNDIDRLETPKNFLPSLNAVLNVRGQHIPTANTWPPTPSTPTEPVTALFRPASRTRTNVGTTMSSRRGRDNGFNIEASPASAKSSTSSDSSTSGDAEPRPRTLGRFTERLDISANAEWFERHLSVDSGYEADSEQELYEVGFIRLT